MYGCMDVFEQEYRGGRAACELGIFPFWKVGGEGARREDDVRPRDTEDSYEVIGLRPCRDVDKLHKG